MDTRAEQLVVPGAKAQQLQAVDTQPTDLPDSVVVVDAKHGAGS